MSCTRNAEGNKVNVYVRDVVIQRATRTTAPKGETGGMIRGTTRFYRQNCLELTRTIEIVNVQPVNTRIQEYLPVHIPGDITTLVNSSFKL